MPERRIVYFAPGWPPSRFSNGIVTYVGNLRPALAEEGFASRVLAGEVKGEDAASDPDIADMHELQRHRSLSNKIVDRALYRVAPERSGPYRTARDLVAFLGEVARTFPFDIFEMEESFGFAGLVAPRIAARTVVRLHGPWFLAGEALGVAKDSEFERRVERERNSIERAAAVSAPSRDVLDRVRRRYELPLENAAIVPNPAPEVRAEDCWSRTGCEPQTILFVGRFDRLKGADLVIDAFCDIARERPQAELLFAGPDPGYIDDAGRTLHLPEYLETRVPENEVRSRVRFLGPQPREAMGALRRRAFVTIVASRFETFSMTVVEALAYGSPLVAADAGAIPELVRNEETALLFKSGDAASLAAKLRLLLGDPERAERLARAGRAEYEARFLPRVVAKAMAAFYRRVLEESPAWQKGARKMGGIPQRLRKG